MKNIKNRNEDITKNWIEHCEKLEDKKRARLAKIDQINTKNRIAAIRKTIKYVKTGKADKELTLLLNHLSRVPKKSSR